MRSKISAFAAIAVMVGIIGVVWSETTDDDDFLTYEYDEADPGSVTAARRPRRAAAFGICSFR